VTSSNRAERFNTGADGAMVARPKDRGTFSADPEALCRAPHGALFAAPPSLPKGGGEIPSQRAEASCSSGAAASSNPQRHHAEILHQTKLLYNNRTPDDQRWVFVAIERSLVSIYLRLRILLRRGRKEVKRQCHGRTSTQAGVIGGGALFRCATTIYVTGRR